VQRGVQRVDLAAQRPGQVVEATVEVFALLGSVTGQHRVQPGLDRAHQPHMQSMTHPAQHRDSQTQPQHDSRHHPCSGCRRTSGATVGLGARSTEIYQPRPARRSRRRRHLLPWPTRPPWGNNGLSQPTAGLRAPSIMTARPTLTVERGSTTAITSGGVSEY
jgi:hypothetical protein